MVNMIEEGPLLGGLIILVFIKWDCKNKGKNK